MNTIAKVLNFIRGEIGTVEKGGANNVIYNRVYYGKTVIGSAYAWCCVFVWYVMNVLGMGKLFYDGRKTASCGTLWKWAKGKGQVIPVSEAQAGDWVEFTFKGVEHAHIGICVGKNKTGTTLYMVEGNTSKLNSIGSQTNGDGVYFKKRPISQVFCVIRPKYDSAPIKQVHTIREITVWSCPAKLDACRVKIIPKDYGVQVYDELIESFSGEGDYFFRTIKGAYVLAKYCV